MVVKRSDSDKIRLQLSSLEFKSNFKFESIDAQYSEFGCSFLDKFVYFRNNNIHLRWYKKNNSSRNLLNFNSSSPLRWKKSIILGGYCTTSDGLNLDILKYNEILKQNGYPNYFINAQNSRLQEMIEGVRYDRKNKRPQQNKLSI